MRGYTTAWSPARVRVCMDVFFLGCMFDDAGILVNSVIGMLEGPLVTGVAAVWGRCTVATRVATKSQAASLGMHVKQGPEIGGVSLDTRCGQCVAGLRC